MDEAHGQAQSGRADERDMSAWRIVGATQRKEYCPPIVARIEVGRTAGSNSPAGIEETSFRGILGS